MKTIFPRKKSVLDSPYFKPSALKENPMSKISDKMLELKKIPGLYEFTVVNCFLAGGAVRDSIRDITPKDYDLFFYTDSAKEAFIKDFGRFCEVTGFGNYNWGKFQFVTLETGTPQKVTDNFDWNVNQVWFEFHKSSFSGYRSNTMHLNFNTKARTPLSAIMRLPHLLSKGFKIDQKEMLFAYTFVAMSVNLANPVEVHQQQNFISGNGGQVGGIEEVTERAVKAAKDIQIARSPLTKALS